MEWSNIISREFWETHNDMEYTWSDRKKWKEPGYTSPVEELEKKLLVSAEEPHWTKFQGRSQLGWS